MAYKLDSITLPNPKAIIRDQIETSGTVTTISGATKKDITSRKERFTLVYEMLSQASVAILLGIWSDFETKVFESTESNMTVNPTTVHVEIASRQYNTKGTDYREDLKLILTEVL